MTDLRLYCTCGAKWIGLLPGMVAKQVRAVWDAEHTGEGHAPTNAHRCGMARYTTPPDVVATIVSMGREGCHQKEIAIATGTSQPTVSKIIRQAGIRRSQKRKI